MSTLCRIRCTARFDGLEIVGPTRTEHYARGPLVHRAAAPVAPRARPRKPAAPPKPLPGTHRVAPPKKAPTPLLDAARARGPKVEPVMVSPRAVRRAALRAELASIRLAPGIEAARRRAQIKRQLEQLASKENHR